MNYELWYVFDRSLPIYPHFLTAQGTLPWQPILGSELAKLDYPPLFLVFRNGLQYRHSDFLKVHL